jgi:hypothetical protein
MLGKSYLFRRALMRIQRAGLDTGGGKILEKEMKIYVI